MMNKTNLYNVCQKVNKRKTKNIIEYIKKLDLIGNVEYEDQLKFDNIKERALQQQNPDKMLDIIGFNPLSQDNIFNTCRQHKGAK